MFLRSELLNEVSRLWKLERNKNDGLARKVIIPVSQYRIPLSNFLQWKHPQPPNTRILFTPFHPCQNGKTDIWIEFDLRIWISISTWNLTILRPANWLSSGSRIQNFSFNHQNLLCFVQFLIRKEFPSPISSMRISWCASVWSS